MGLFGILTLKKCPPDKGERDNGEGVKLGQGRHRGQTARQRVRERHRGQTARQTDRERERDPGDRQPERQ